MQRLCALLLLTLSAWLLVAPLAASPAEQNLLPACCRRLGTHHCAAKVLAAEDRDHASFRSTACPLMPHHALAVVQKFAGVLARASLAMLVCRSPFSTTSALEGYARTIALKAPRSPPSFFLA